MDKLKDIASGDRVKVTFEARVDSLRVDGVGVTVTSGCGENWFNALDVSAPSFHIEKLEEPIKVGDRVRWSRVLPSVDLGVIAISGDHAWVSREGDPYAMPRLAELERVK